LSYSIFDLCEKYSNSQIELVSDINKIQRYDQAFEIKINNIIEELVNNILKHSKASEAIISLEQKGRNLYLEITDNGDGFKLDQAVLKDGLGLNQIKARISMMEGSINIDSEEGLGTTINIEVPIVERPIVKREVV
jgi:signal transduction histidine kinase